MHPANFIVSAIAGLAVTAAITHAIGIHTRPYRHWLSRMKRRFERCTHEPHYFE